MTYYSRPLLTPPPPCTISLFERYEVITSSPQFWEFGKHSGPSDVRHNFCNGNNLFLILCDGHVQMNRMHKDIRPYEECPHSLPTHPLPKIKVHHKSVSQSLHNTRMAILGGLGDWANFVLWVIFSKIFKH